MIGEMIIVVTITALITSVTKKMYEKIQELDKEVYALRDELNVIRDVKCVVCQSKLSNKFSTSNRICDECL